MYLKPVDYDPIVRKRINKNPNLLDYREIEKNVYFGVKIWDRGRRYYVIYIKEKSRERRIKKRVKVFVYFMDYGDRYYVNQIHIEISY